MRTLILILLLACTACTTEARDPGRQAPGANPGASGAPAPDGNTLARIRALVGDATCTESSQCRSLPIGANPCGGPQDYLAYSLSRSNEKALLALADQYKAERQAEIKASGMMSICRHLPDPGAVCSSGLCRPGGASPAAR